MLDPIFRVSQLTLPVATIICTAWVAIEKTGEAGFLFFLGGIIFTIALRFIEQAIFADNVSRGRYTRHNY